LFWRLLIRDTFSTKFFNIGEILTVKRKFCSSDLIYDVGWIYLEGLCLNKKCSLWRKNSVLQRHKRIEQKLETHLKSKGILELYIHAHIKLSD